jgi:hypothetical protein
MDAIGCQHEIAGQITGKGGHYPLSWKENQRGLYEDTVCGFEACVAESVSEEWEYEHGRYEVRECGIIKAQDAQPEENLKLWGEPNTLIKIEAKRIIKEKETYPEHQQVMLLFYLLVLFPSLWRVKGKGYFDTSDKWER